MTAKHTKIPLLKLHKASRQGYVRIDGRVLYFGVSFRQARKK